MYFWGVVMEYVAQNLQHIHAVLSSSVATLFKDEPC